MLNLPKINIGSKKKKSFFDQSHDVNTTSDFGFCQPTLIDTIPADTNVTLKTQSFVRLAPLIAPSFARIKMRTENIFIPMEDVFEGYKYMLSGESINARALYTPIQADYVNSKQLWGYALLENWQYAFLLPTEALMAAIFLRTAGYFCSRSSTGSSASMSWLKSVFIQQTLPHFGFIRIMKTFCKCCIRSLEPTSKMTMQTAYETILSSLPLSGKPH